MSRQVAPIYNICLAVMKEQDKHDVILPYVFSSKDNFSVALQCGERMEIEYVIRSLQKFCSSWLGRIFIVGDNPPAAIADSVIHVPCDNPFTHIKDANLVYKVEYAIRNIPDLSDDFILVSDDQIVTKESVWEDFVPRTNKKKPYKFDAEYWKSRLENKSGIDENGTYLWRKSMYETLSKFQNPQWFEAHIWSPMNKKKFIEMVETYDYRTDIGCVIMTLYYNFAKVDYRLSFDHKWLSKFNFIKKLDLKIFGYRHLAWTDSVFRQEPFRSYIEKLLFDK